MARGQKGTTEQAGIKVRVKLISSKAKVPEYQTEGASAFDLHVWEDVVCHPGAVTLVKTGIAVEVPPGYEVQIRPRSGLAIKNRIMVVEEGPARLGPVPLAPFPVRKLLMVEGLPEAANVNVTVPFNHWLSSAQFSPDGLKIVYAAPDQFWKVALGPATTFTLFEVMLEGGARQYNPPSAAVEGGH